MADADAAGVRRLEDADLHAHFAGLTEEERVREFFFDPNCGLPSERAWEVFQGQPPAGRPLFAHYSIEGVAWINDAFGHDAGQTLYRVAAEALASVDGAVSKVRGDFAGFAATEADAVNVARAATRRLPPEFHGLKITAAADASWDEARAKHGRMKEFLEGTGVRARRGTRPFGLNAGWRPADPAHWGPKTAEKTVPGRVDLPVPESLLASYRALPAGEVERLTYRDPLTGLLGPTGMGVLGRRGDQTLSVDVDGLRVTDETNAALGDAVLRRVGTVMARLQGQYGEEMYAAHPHGDEFAARHPDARLLARYAERVKEALANEVVIETSVEMGKTYVQNGIGLSYGVGSTADIAEAELKRDKAERVVEGDRDPKGERLIASGRLTVRAATAEELAGARKAKVEAIREKVATPEVDAEGRARLMASGIRPETLDDPAVSGIVGAASRRGTGDPAVEVSPTLIRKGSEPVARVFAVADASEALALWQEVRQGRVQADAVLCLGGYPGDQRIAQARALLEQAQVGTIRGTREVVVSMPPKGWAADIIGRDMAILAGVDFKSPPRGSWCAEVEARERDWIRRQNLTDSRGHRRAAGVSR